MKSLYFKKGLRSIYVSLFFLFFLTICVRADLQSQNINVSDSGIFKQFFYPDGKLSSEGYMKSGKPEGYWKSYDRDGRLASEGNRINNQLDGVWKFYTEGKLSSEITYASDKKNGLSKYYQDSLVIEEEYKNNILHGQRRIYRILGSKPNIFKITAFENGLEQGLQKEYGDSGVIVLITTYRKGYIVSREMLNQKDTLGRKQGIWKDLYPNDQIYWEVPYSDNKRNGFYKEYDTAGNILKIEKYVNGEKIVDAPELKPVEIKTEYYPDGKPKLTVPYKNGKPEGVAREYDTITGKVKRGIIFKEGVVIGGGLIDEQGFFLDNFKEYYDNGNLKAEGKFKRGQKSGSWRYYYPDGTLEEEGEYKNGKLEGRWLWYFPDGTIRIEQDYYNGKADGSFVEYNEQGQVVAKGSYVEDLEEGAWEYLQGEERITGKYSAGNRNGLWKSYWNTKGNKLSFRGSFVDDQPNGKHLYFWDNGQLRAEEYYSIGKRVGVWRKYDEDGKLILRIKINADQEEERYNGIKTVKERNF